ncbi:MarR family winged helix-turn-helix transcriptional regulator [Bradyrhizobium liaoningense]|uniref:MarR family winged helix-turn-helix transcriptional regulator n=1 Tax=Bradyrhizobium liaoningense TaxID=43992 RepID=UPI001BA85ACE|nr:MarR family winged helix-turn-helix transcriptional regulator [Bradyrhizobium liaoningense]MBR0857725.1 winged helix-turn-helix transcriptional regulator [Bradyrhizobium liaoningense]
MPTAIKIAAKNSRAPQARDSSRDHLNNKLFFRLFQAANIYETQAVRLVNFSAVSGATLGALSRDPKGMLFSDLYDYLGVSRQNLDAVLKGLEKKGLVERVEVEADRRKRMVCLTPAGVEAWEDLYARSLEFFRQGTKGVSASEIADCTETLSRIARALRTAQLD